MKLKRWETVVSDIEELYFRKLTDGDGGATFEMEDNSGTIFEADLGVCGPYLVCDEEYLTKYWSIKEMDMGRSFIVEETDFPELFPGLMSPDDYTHYVIATYDVCLEVLSKVAPSIRVRQKTVR